jgi:hypothetical protein
MPIINCTDCKKEMSDAAPSCPHCGRPNSSVTPLKRSVGILLGIGILLFPLIFAWFTLRRGHTAKAKIISFAWLAISIIFILAQDAGTKSSTSASPIVASVGSASSTEPPTKPVMQVNIRQILSDYKNNEVGADNKYKGNYVQVTGIVSEIKKDIMSNLYVTIGTGAQFEIPEIQAFFDDSTNDQLARLSKGQSLTITCRIDGLMMNVLGRDCVIQ